MRSPLVLALVIGLACEGFSAGRLLYYSLQHDQLCWGGVCGPRADPLTVRSIQDSIILRIRPPVGGQLFDGTVLVGRGSDLQLQYMYSYSAMSIAAAQVNQYEQADCNTRDGIIYGDGASLQYVKSAVFRKEMFCLSSSTGYYACATTWDGADQSGLVATYTQAVGYCPYCKPSYRYSTRCRDRSVVQTPSYPVLIRVRVSATDPLDTCSSISDAACNACSWPYLAKSNGSCGCTVDKTRYQTVEDLRKRLYLYCQTYNDGSGAQYYYDESRSCLNSANCGVPKGACSSPQTGKTIYMPAQQCPDISVATGVNGDTLSVPDSLGQPAVYNPADGPSTGGTGSGLDSGGVYSRLDTIIGLLRRGGTGGSDTSLRTYLDTVGSGRADPLDSAFGGYVDSLMGTGDSIQGSVLELTGVVGDHTSRGDTSGIGGYTLDSLIDVCFTIHDSAFCLRDAGAGWTFMRTAAYWIRRLILVLWGFVCAYMFYVIAKDQ